MGQQLILADSRRKVSVGLAIGHNDLDGRNQLQEMRHSLRPLVTHANNLEINHSFPSFLSRRFASMQRPSPIVLCFFRPLGGESDRADVQGLAHDFEIERVAGQGAIVLRRPSIDIGGQKVL
jgi:hypothetical protein